MHFKVVTLGRTYERLKNVENVIRLSVPINSNTIQWCNIQMWHKHQSCCERLNLAIFSYGKAPLKRSIEHYCVSATRQSFVAQRWRESRACSREMSRLWRYGFDNNNMGLRKWHGELGDCSVYILYLKYKKLRKHLHAVKYITFSFFEDSQKFQLTYLT